ncbi:MAG: DUF4290 domain-containing protein [Cyclobacteriaceae bacterium]
MKDYNSTRPALILKEYGRNIQKLVAYLKTIEEKEKRTMAAHTLIELMKQINPAIRETQETNQKLWDDLFIMADFDIDIDSPYPVPEPEILTRKPKRMPYSMGRVRFKHYGKNMQLLVQTAAAIENEDERQEALIYIGRLMRSFHAIWNKENVEEFAIVENIKTMAGQDLGMNLQRIKEEGLFESSVREQREQREPKEREQRPNRNGNQNYKQRNSGQRNQFSNGNQAKRRRN